MKLQINQIPVVDEILMQFLPDELEDTFILACQHLLLDAYLLLHSMKKIGLSAKNVAIMGKCYSNSPTVIQKIKQEGFDVFVPSPSFDSHLSFDQQFRNQIIDFLNIQLKKRDFSTFKRVIILDDGGELISIVNELFPDLQNVIGVEQTSSGFSKLKIENLKFPVINVARSKSKLNVESPIIARIVLERLEIFLNSKKLIPINWLILGNGPIGRSIYNKLLMRNINADIYDSNISLSHIKKNKLKYHISKSDVILGCTGLTSINQSQHLLLKNDCVLASASSSDREFDAAYLRRLSHRTDDCHVDLHVNGIYLLNSGFPINFFGEEQSMPLYERQFVMALLISAICQTNKNLNYNEKLIEVNPMYETLSLKSFNAFHSKKAYTQRYFNLSENFKPTVRIL